MLRSHRGLSAVVAPVFNEPETWRGICLELATYFDCVVVIDDGSDVPLIKEPDDPFVVLRHTKNMGKGQALATGFQYCLSQGATVLGAIDTDGEHDPRNFYEALQRPLAADLVNFSRAGFFGNYGFYRRNRNRVISKLLSNKLECSIRDSQSGMRLFSARAARAFLNAGLPAGYAVETAMLEIVKKEHFQIVEVPMAFEGEIRNGKKYSSISAFIEDIFAFTGSLARRKGKEDQVLRRPKESPLLKMRLEDSDTGLK